MGSQRLRDKNKKEPHTLKVAMVNGTVLEIDPKLELKKDDFSPDVDSTVLIRERFVVPN